MTRAFRGLFAFVVPLIILVWVAGELSAQNENAAVAAEDVLVDAAVNGELAAPTLAEEPLPAAEVPVVEPVAEPVVDPAPPVPEAPAAEPVPVVAEEAPKLDEAGPVPDTDAGKVVAGVEPDAVLPGAPAEVPAVEPPVVAEEPAAPVAEPAAEVPVEPVAEPPAIAEPVAEVPAEPVAEAPAEPVADVPAEVPAVEPPVVAEEPAVPVAEPAAEAPAEPVAEVPGAETPAEAVEAPDGDGEAAAAPDLDAVVDKAMQDAVAGGVEQMPEDLAQKADAVAAGKPVLPAAPAGDIAAMEDQEVLKRKAFEQHGVDSLETAEKAVSDKDFVKAMAYYRESMQYLGRRPETRDLFERARRGLADASYRQAVLLGNKKEYDQAMDMAKNANTFGHPDALRLIDQLKLRKDQKDQPAEVKVDKVKPRRTEQDYRAFRADIQSRMKKGREFFQAGEYERAGQEFEAVLKHDPANTEAIRMMEKIGRMKFDRSTEELEATRKNMIGSVRDTWNPRNYAVDEDNRKVTVGPGGGSKPTEIDTDRARVLNKMEKITIPEIDFRQANIHDVVEFLTAASQEFDTVSKDDEVKGVNIILNLQAGGAAPAAAAAPAEGGDLFGEAAADAPAAGGDVPLITFQARYVSVLQTLKIVTDVANLKYKIDGNVVMIVPKNVADDVVVHRMYDVLSSVIEKVQVTSGELFGGGGGGGDGGGFIDMGGGGGGGDAGGGPDLKSFFKGLGVAWPEGSSIRHVPSIGKLVVANTAENLTIFERVLGALNVVPNQIEIEARFVEVQQKDLEALGFEWMLTDDWEIAQRAGSGLFPMATRPQLKMRANSTSGGFTAGNRFTEDIEGGAIGSDVLRIGSVLTNPEVSMILHMLAQRGNNDLLSAPKVVTQSGAEATIKVVTEYIYPTDFSVEPVTGTDADGNSVITGGIVEPRSFETREVGVILSVVPEVSPEGQMITLAMSPEVVSEPEWYEYGSEFTSGENTVRLNMRQPFFHTRRVNTTISIYNGATVMMGGMITEGRQSVDDKIPLLGDIPFLGRLFRSKYDNSDKRNLLIFVTARLVDPAGRPVKPQEDITKFMQNPVTEAAN